ncbi:MAG: hypothetical protein K2N54_08590, partial [Helicobacter sp.]|nr:hypothetical protein [Helicobacter sp.]
GTQGVETTNPDGTTNPNDTQNIVVNTSSATLNINGAGGVDKFNIEASSFTKTLTISGNLGTVPNYEEAKNNYDSVRIDLSKTSGVDLNIGNLLVSNPNNEGIVITASKGADNITLVAGANHDVIEFTAGGGAGNVNEEYTVDLGNMSLSKYQTFTIDGLTITNISANKLNAYAIADAIQAWVNNGNSYATVGGTVTEISWTSAGGKVAGSSGAMNTIVDITGKLERLKGAWKGATIEWEANSNQFVVKALNGGNLADLNFTFDANANAAIAAGAETTLSIRAASAAAAVAGSANAAAATDITLQDVGDGTNANTSTISLGGVEIVVEATAGTSFTAAELVTEIKSLVENGTYNTTVINGTNVKLNKVGSFTTIGSGDAEAVKALFTLPEGYAWSFNSSKISIIAADTKTTESLSTVIVTQTQSDTTNFSDATATKFTGTAYKAATEGKITVDFGDGLLAGQSYTFNGKTVVATADLTGEEVAEAFTYRAGEAFDGAVIVSDWTPANIVEAKVAYGIDGTTLTILDQGTTSPSTPSGILSVATDVITGTGALAVNIKNVSATTTQQGQNEEQILADSYITAFVAEAGKAASTADAGVATKIVANTNALDTITNFDISNDKLALNKFDSLNDGSAGRYVATDGASFSALSGDAIYVDTAGNTLAASANAGIISFSAGNAEASAITLEHKLFAAISNMGNSKVAGFEHGGDFYVIATGTVGTTTTDDLVIKLAGVSGVTDIGTILG